MQEKHWFKSIEVYQYLITTPKEKNKHKSFWFNLLTISIAFSSTCAVETNRKIFEEAEMSQACEVLW